MCKKKIQHISLNHLSHNKDATVAISLDKEG